MANQSKMEALVIKNFTEYQKSGGESTKSRRANDGSVESRVTRLKSELSALLLQEGVEHISLDDKDDLDSPLYAITSAVLQCVDAAIATAISKDLVESIDKILELAACFAAQHGHIANAVVTRAEQFSAVIMERVRSQACKLLGLCVHFMNECETKTSNNDNDSFLGSSDQDDASWKNKCKNAAQQALIVRLMDKSQAVRNEAILACQPFFVDNIDDTPRGEENYDLLEALLWNINHDPSVANRMAALRSVPLTVATVDDVIARVRDVNVKVRVEALNVLSSKLATVSFTPEQYAELVRSGLTDRCVFTATKEYHIVIWLC